MKAATGELNLTLITVVALGALLALFTTVLWPTIKNRITKNWNDVGNNADKLSYNYENYDFPNCMESELF